MNRVTDFNTEEIQSYISNGWFDAQDKLNNPALGGKDKPTVHNGQASNVNRKQASKWNSNKCSTMANQRDFLDELRRQLNT